MLCVFFQEKSVSLIEAVDLLQLSSFALSGNLTPLCRLAALVHDKGTALTCLNLSQSDGLRFNDAFAASFSGHEIQLRAGSRELAA